MEFAMPDLYATLAEEVRGRKRFDDWSCHAALADYMTENGMDPLLVKLNRAVVWCYTRVRLVYRTWNWRFTTGHTLFHIHAFPLAGRYEIDQIGTVADTSWRYLCKTLIAQRSNSHKSRPKIYPRNLIGRPQDHQAI